MTTAAVTTERELAEVLLANIETSTTNPRRRFDHIDELTASIQAKGIRVPLLVRLNPAGPGYELIDGERRLRAARLAGLTYAPAIIEDLNDHDAREIQILANLQRQDVHPLDEGDGFRALMDFDRAYTVEAMAAKFGKSERYIRDRLKLGELIPPARETFEADRITAGHAVLIARLAPDLQAAALEACFYPLYGSSEETSEPAPIGKLRDWINRTVPVDVTQAASTPELFSDEDSKRIATAIEDGGETAVLLLTHDWTAPKLPKGSPKVLGSTAWKEITGKKDRCEHAQVGVIGLGRDRAQVLTVCATKKCQKHFPPAVMREGADTDPNGVQYSRAAQQAQREEQAARAKREEEERKAWEALKPIAFAALAEHLKGTPLTATLVRDCLNQDREIIELTGPLKPGNFGQALALNAVFQAGTWTRERFLRAVKPFKFNLKSAEQVAKQKAPAAAAHARKKSGRA